MDKSRPDDMSGVTGPQQAAEQAVEASQKRERYKGNCLRGLRPIYLQRKAQEYLLERPNAARNNFCTQIFQKNLILEVTTTFLKYEEQVKANLATLGQEKKNLRSELRESNINAIAVSCRTFHHGQQGRQKTTRFCDCCPKNGHTLKWCRRKMRDEKVRKTRLDMSSKNKISPLQNYFTSHFNHRQQNDQTMNHFHDPYDRTSSTEQCLSKVKANWQHEVDQFFHPERRFFQRKNGMSFKIAEFTASGKSDDERCDPLPLGF